MSVTVTLVYPDAAAAASALARLAGVISPEDRPDAGGAGAKVIEAAVTQLVMPPAADPAAVFGAPPVAALPVPPLPAPAPPASAPVPVPPAPTLPIALAGPAAAPLPQRDSRGIPYDARIHSSPPNLTDKNIWRKKRGVDEITVNRIEAELTGAAAAPPAPVVPPAPPAPVAPPTPPVAEDFPALMARLGPYFVADMAGTTAKLTAALEPLGISAFPMLATRPDLMPAATAAINAALA